MQQPPDGAHQLVDLLLRVAWRAALALHAVTGVIVEQAEGDLVKRGLNRRDLSQDVDAIALVLNHPGDAAHLPFDPCQAFEQLLFGGRVATAWRGRRGFWFRHSSEYTPTRYSGFGGCRSRQSSPRPQAVLPY